MLWCLNFDGTIFESLSYGPACFGHRVCDAYHTFFELICIGVGRFRILGGQGLEYWGGGQGGPNSQQAHDVVMTSMRRNDVASTSFRHHVPNRCLIDQCQIIAFFHLKSFYKIQN